MDTNPQNKIEIKDKSSGVIDYSDISWTKKEFDELVKPGDIVYVEIDTLNSKLDAEEVFGSVEAVKTVSDLFMPVIGEIIEINGLLEDTPEIVNEDPYGEGWMVKIRCSDLDQSKNLLDHKSYDTLLKNG